MTARHSWRKGTTHNNAYLTSGVPRNFGRVRGRGVRNEKNINPTDYAQSMETPKSSWGEGGAVSPPEKISGILMR